MSAASTTPPRRLNLPNAVRVLGWLTADTFRQSLSSFIFWVMLLVSVAAIVFCFGIGMEGGAQRLQGEQFLPGGPAAVQESPKAALDRYLRR